MATTTTNFGWDIPQSTDLVKDGATAIAALGQDIDTSMVDLKGGTTGQILSKASGTDMDFTWINNDQGDITGVTAGTGLTGGGTSGSVTLDFDVANYGGGQYAAGKNKVLNGDFGINQRNFTSITTSDTFGFDRWSCAITDGTVTYTPQTFTLGAAPVSGYEGTNYARIQTTGQTLATARANFNQKIESVRTFAGQTVTLSFWAKAASGTPKIATEILQNFGTGGSPSSSVFTYGGQVTLSTSWARYSVTINVPSISGKTIGTSNDLLAFQLWLSAGTDFNARTGSLGIQTNTFDIWGVQLEAGSTATPFQTATGTKQGELAACQRYYWRNSGASANNVILPICGSSGSSTTPAFVFQPPVTMRVAPTSIDFANLQAADQAAGYALSSLAINANSQPNLISITASATGLTAYRPLYINASTSNAYIGFSAEL